MESSMSNLFLSCERVYLAINNNHANTTCPGSVSRWKYAIMHSQRLKGWILERTMWIFLIPRWARFTNSWSFPGSRRNVSKETTWECPMLHGVFYAHTDFIYIWSRIRLAVERIQSHWHLAKPQQLKPLLLRPDESLSMVLEQVRSSFGALPDHQYIRTLDELLRISQQARKTLQEPIFVRSNGRPRQHIESKQRDFSDFESVKWPRRHLI